MDYLFSKVFNNKILREKIFNDVHQISPTQRQGAPYKWNQVLESPVYLAGNGYNDLFKEYFKRNGTKKLDETLFLHSILRSNNFDALKYSIEVLAIDYRSTLKSFLGTGDYKSLDTLYYATFYSNLEIVKYIDSLLEFNSNNNSDDNNSDNNSDDNNKSKSWDYATALYKTKDIEVLKYLATKAIQYQSGDEKLERGLNKSICNGFELGRKDMVDWIVEHSPVPIQIGTLEQVRSAIRSGNLELLTLCLSKDDYHKFADENLIDIAAFNHLNIVQWLHFNKIGRVTAEAINNAASNKQWNIVKWLHENRTEGCTKRAMDCTASFGNMEMLKWFNDNITEGCSTLAMDTAGQFGHFETIKWLHKNRTEGCTTKAMDGAIEKGYLEMIKWLHENRTEGCTQAAMNLAANFGHLETVKWLHENRTEGFTTVAMDNAAYNGHLDVVKWLHENRTEGCSSSAMDLAQNLEVVQWLHENRTEGCTTFAVNVAAQSGDLERVKWLLQNRTEGCTKDAVENNKHEEVVNWINENLVGGFREEIDIHQVDDQDQMFDVVVNPIDNF